MRRWRQVRALTLSEASSEIGLPKSTLSKIENGKVPSPKVMPLICRATGLSPNDFYPPAMQAAE